MLKAIVHELEHHAPFTVFGAVLAVLFMAVAQGMSREITHMAFGISHPLHVFLSAIATASMYQIHICKQADHKCNPFKLLLVGYFGSIGVATLSDSLIPFGAELLLDFPSPEPHIGFIETWWLVNPLAIAGVAVAYFWPATKIPHAGHVLLSTWASLFHMMMAFDGGMTWALACGVLVFLFIAVWVPCCMSDIIFPLLFVGKEKPA